MNRSSVALATVLMGLLLPVTAHAQAASPERTVQSAEELRQLLDDPSFTGRIVIPAGKDFTLDGPIGLRPGIQLVGRRGPLGERPVLRQRVPGWFFRIEEARDVRIEGLHLAGPRRTKDRFQTHSDEVAIGIVQDPEQPKGGPVVIADNEIDHWAVAVDVAGTRHADTNEAYDAPCGQAGCPKLSPADAGRLRVERNYIHENAAKGGGYGVAVGGGAYATIEANVFEYNNHSITASGRAYSGYVARFNYVLRGVLTFGDDRTYPHSFDVHGRGGAKEKKYSGGLGGYFFEVSNNTVLGSQDYGFLGRLTRAAFALRGKPTRGVRFRGNVLTHDPGEAIKPGSFGLSASGTKHSTDYSDEIAAGDFDGDGRDDVLVANGTGWFVSRAGVAPWEFLMPSRLRIQDVHLADVDGDRRTDVIVGAPGQVGYHSAGRGPLKPLAGSPVAAWNLRSGDFDADGRTDLFATSAGQWRIRSGRTGAWTDAQTSGAPIDRLLVGSFDAAPGADVLTISHGNWVVSSGGRHGWRRVGPKRSDSLGGAVAHDFDGNGVTDIAFTKGGAWRLSRDARGPLETIRGGTESRLADQAIGRFDGGDRIKVIGFRADKLARWNGLGAGQSMPARSWHNMR